MISLIATQKSDVLNDWVCADLRLGKPQSQARLGPHLPVSLLISILDLDRIIVLLGVNGCRFLSSSINIGRMSTAEIKYKKR